VPYRNVTCGSAVTKPVKFKRDPGWRVDRSESKEKLNILSWDMRDAWYAENELKASEMMDAGISLIAIIASMLSQNVWGKGIWPLKNHVDARSGWTHADCAGTLSGMLMIGNSEYLRQNDNIKLCWSWSLCAFSESARNGRIQEKWSSTLGRARYRNTVLRIKQLVRFCWYFELFSEIDLGQYLLDAFIECCDTYRVLWLQRLSGLLDVKSILRKRNRESVKFVSPMHNSIKYWYKQFYLAKTW
jgi:hypothetical protein